MRYANVGTKIMRSPCAAKINRLILGSSGILGDGALFIRFIILPNCRIVPGFVSDSRGVFRTNAGQRSGKPQGIRTQMRRLFIRTPATCVASGRSTGNGRQDVEGSCRGWGGRCTCGVLPAAARGGRRWRTGCSGRSRHFPSFPVPVLFLLLLLFL